MKKLIIVFAALFAGAATLSSQTIEYTDIQINTETQKTVVTTDPLEPLPHTFINVGLHVNKYLGGCFKLGWYKKHGFYAGFSYLSSTSHRGTKSTDTPSGTTYVPYHMSITGGYVYNIPLSLTTGRDKDNLFQLLCGIGYGENITSWTTGIKNKTTYERNAAGFALEPAFMFRFSAFNMLFGGNFILGQQCSAAFQFGIGITFGKS